MGNDSPGNQLQYTGKKQPQAGERDPQNGQLILPYLPNQELVEAVNLAIVLGRPLFLKGEPGCGKTRLARAVAYELNLPFEAWYVKSTSRAQDGLYVYDAVGRLRDAQLAVSPRAISNEGAISTNDANNYIQMGPLGRAFQKNERCVVLIDEIDKADIDFPNDLLLELDQRFFTVAETGETIRANAPPIVFITSNDEKELPDAFLRRCLFHYVEFPNPERLQEIINRIFPDLPSTLVEKALIRFVELRKEMYRDKGSTGKKVSTSELIDWLNVLQRYPEEKVLKDLEGKLPYAGVLLKSWEDHRRYLSESPS